MKSLSKKIILLVLKVLILLGLFVWLYKQNRLDFNVFTQIELNKKTIIIFVGGALAVLMGLLLLGLRLMMLLRFKRFLVNYSRVLGITMVGSFLSVVLPGLVGGDAMKAVYLCSNVAERRTDALAAVLIDRIFGLYSLLLLATIMLGIAWCHHDMTIAHPALYIAPTVVISLGVGMLLMTSDYFVNNVTIKKVLSYLPKRLNNLVKALHEYMRNPRLVVTIIILSLCNHALLVLSFFAAAILLKDHLPIMTHYILNPLAMVMNMIPLTPGGLGVAESAFSFLFQAAGSSQGAVIGLLGRFIQYIVFIFSGSIAISILKLRSKICVLEEAKEEMYIKLGT